MKILHKPISKLFIGILLLSTVIIISWHHLAVSALNKNATQLTNTQIVTKADKVLHQYLTIKSRFKQVDAQNKTSYGWFIFDKKQDKARIEYDEHNVRIIINNDSVMFEQIKLNEKSFTPLLSNPLKYIVSKKASLTDSDEIAIENVISTAKSYIITVSSKENPTAGQIAMEFNHNSFKLTGWTIIDSSGGKTSITLMNPSFSNKAVPSYIFNTHRIKEVNFTDL